MVRLRPCFAAIDGVENLCEDKYDCVCGSIILLMNRTFATGVPESGETCVPVTLPCLRIRKIDIGWNDAPAELVRRASPHGGLKGYRFEICIGDDVFSATSSVSRFAPAPIEETAPEDGVSFDREEIFPDCEACYGSSGNVQWPADRFIRVIAIAADEKPIALCNLGFVPNESGGSCAPESHYDPEVGDCVAD